MTTKNLLTYSVGLIALTVITTLAACGSKNNDHAPVPGNVIAQCLGCQPISGNTFFQTESQDSNGLVRFSLNFSGQTQNNNSNLPYNQYNPYGSVNNNNIYGGSYSYGNQYNNSYENPYVSPINSHNGPVAAQGSMSLAQGMALGYYCQVPAGNYTLGTLSLGQWYSGSISNLRLKAYGPATMILLITTGQVEAKTQAQLGQTWSEVALVGRLFANVVIESVNGYACNSSILVQ